MEGVRYTLGLKSFWRGTLQAAADVPLDHQLFLLWMAFILNRRASNAATSAAVAGGAAVAGSS